MRNDLTLTWYRKAILVAAIAIFIDYGLVAKANSILWLDTSESSVRWRGERLLGFQEGSLSFCEGKIQGDQLKLTVDVNTLKPDSMAIGILTNKLRNHLLSKDFLWSEENPWSHFDGSIKKIAKNTATLQGNLQIRGVNQRIQPFSAEILISANKAAITGRLTIDRTRWQIKYLSMTRDSNSVSNNLISKDVRLELSLYFTNNKPVEHCKKKEI